MNGSWRTWRVRLSSASARRGSVFALVAGAVAAFAIHLSAPPAPGEEPIAETAPAGAPATPPGVGPVGDERTTLPIFTAATVEEALAFSPDEKEVLADVYDGDGQLQTSALYVLLRRAEMLPPAAFEQAEQPNPKSLWTEPARYRGRLVRLEGQSHAPPADWSGEVTYTRWWGDRPVHVAYLKVAGASEPVLVFLTRKPPARLPDRLRVAGLFYKLVKLAEKTPGGEPTGARPAYPVIVAKEFQAAPGARGFPAELGILLAVVILMLAAFMFLRRYAGRRPVGAWRGFPDMRPEGPDRRPAPAAEGEAGQDVDAELRRQVEAYRARRKEGAEGDDGERTDNPR